MFSEQTSCCWRSPSTRRFCLRVYVPCWIAMSEEAVIRVVLIDDHEMILQSMVRLLGDDPQIAVVGTALTAELGIDVTQTQRPDIVIVDYSLTDMDAPDAIKLLRTV